MVIPPLSWQPVPVLNNPLGEEIFPAIQMKSLLVQLEAVFFHSVAYYLEEVANPHLTTTPFQAVVECSKALLSLLFSR